MKNVINYRIPLLKIIATVLLLVSCSVFSFSQNPYQLPKRKKSDLKTKPIIKSKEEIGLKPNIFRPKPPKAYCGYHWKKTNGTSQIKEINGNWGIANDNSVWRFENYQWVLRNAGDKLVKISGNWGISPSGAVYYWNQKDSRWEQRNPGNYLRDVTFTGIGISSNSEVWHFESGHWNKKNPGFKLRDVDGYRGIDSNNNLWDYNGSKWIKNNSISNVKEVEGDWVLTRNGEIWQYDFAARKWIVRHGGNNTQVTANSWAISSSGGIMKMQSNGSWYGFNTPSGVKFSFIHYSYNSPLCTVFAIDTQGQTWTTYCECSSIQ